jgi:hypothetical protein
LKSFSQTINLLNAGNHVYLRDSYNGALYFGSASNEAIFDTAGDNHIELDSKYQSAYVFGKKGTWVNNSKAGGSLDFIGYNSTISSYLVPGGSTCVYGGGNTVFLSWLHGNEIGFAAIQTQNGSAVKYSVDANGNLLTQALSLSNGLNSVSRLSTPAQLASLTTQAQAWLVGH